MTSAYSPETKTTLYASDNTKLVKQGINLPVGGYITISGNVTVAALFAQGNSGIHFADENSSLTVSGPVYVAGDNTLTITPATLTTTDTAKTLISASVIGSASNVSVTVPTESGYRYVSSVVGDTAVTLIRYKDIGLDYTATPDGGFYAGSSWFTSFGNYYTPEAYRVGPSATYPAVSEVKTSAFNPYQNYTAALPFSFAIYADLSEMAENTIIMAFGTESSGIIMYKNGDDGGNVRVGRATNGNISDGYAKVARPNSGKGYHLYTVTCAADGSLNLYVDDGTVNGSGTIATDALAAGFQIGSIYGGGTISWLSAGNNMAVAKILGWNGVLSAEDVAALAQEYPATTGTIDRNISWNNSGNTLKVYSSEEDSTARSINVDAGDVTIVSGEEVSVSKLLTQPSGIEGEIGASSVTVAGTLNINGSDSTIGSTAGDASICLGYWVRQNQSGAKTTALTVASGGVLNAPDAYVQMPWSTHCQGATFNVNGTAKVKAVYRNSAGASGTLNLANGGTLEVASILSTGGDITKNFGYGTFKVDADAEETRAINFNASSTDSPTTLDPNGHTLTMAAAAMTGSGAVTVGGSNGGTVVFSGWTSSFTGTLVYTAENSSMISVSSWDSFAGTISGEITITDDNASQFADFPWGSFTGTLNYAVTGGTLDLSTYTMTYATINVTGTGAKVILKENSFYKFNVSAGASAEVLVSADTYHYAGYVPSGTIAGTVTYKYTDDDGVTYSEVASDAYNGANLLPYWQIFKGHADGDNLAGTLSTPTDWKGGSVVTTRNVAFNVTDGKTLTITVDNANTYSFGEVQIYGDGKVVFAGEGSMSVSSALYVTEGTEVEIQSGVTFGITAGIVASEGATATLNGTDITVPIVSGAGGVVVATDSSATITQSNVGLMTVDGTMTAASAAAIVPTSLVVSESGVINVPSNGSVAPTEVSGTGRIVFTGRLPTSTAWATGTATTGWRGTVAVKDYSSSSANPWEIANYGNRYSVLEVDNCYAYYTKASSTGPTLNLVGDGLKIANGNGDDTTTYAALSGSGTLTAENAPFHCYKFGTGENFTGSIKNNGRRIVFGTSTPTQNAGNAYSITIDSGYVATLGDGATWTTTRFFVNGTLNVAGTGILEGAVTAANSAKIVLNDSPLTISGTLTATALEVDPGAIALSTTPTAIITGLTAAPTITGLTVENCDITTSEVDGKYVIYAAYKDTAWSGESGDWTESLFNGGALETDGEDVSFVAGASGAVTVTLDGTRTPANVVFNGGSTTTYTLTGGKFSPSGTVTVESGSVVISSEVTSGVAFSVAAGAKLTLSNATGVTVSGSGELCIADGGTVTLAAIDAIDGIASLSGSGSLVLPSAAVPGSSLQTLLKNSNWSGTVAFSNLAGDTTTQQWRMYNYGNSGSKIQFTNCIISYPINDNNDEYSGKLVLDGDNALKFTVDNGYSNNRNLLGELIGLGTLTSSGDNTQLYMFLSSPDFNGNISTTGKRIMFASQLSDGTANYANDTGAWAGTVRIASGASASIGAGANWVAFNGFGIYGTLIVKGANSYLDYNNSGTKGIILNNGATIRFDSLSTLKFGNNTLRTPTVAAGSTVNIAFGDGVTPVEGTKLISWGGEPAGDFQFANSSLAENLCLVKAADGLSVVEKSAVTIGEAEFEYLADYSGARTVTATVTGAVGDSAGTTWTLTVGGTPYYGTYQAGENNTGTVTFSNVAGLTPGGSFSYTIEAGGHAAGTTGEKSATAASVTGGWIAEDSTNTGTSAAGGAWSPAITYSGTTATFSGDSTNTFNATSRAAGTVTLTTVVNFGDVADSEVTVDSGAKAAIRVGASGNSNVFQLWSRPSASAAAEWLTVEGATPNVEESSTVVFTFDTVAGTYSASVNGSPLSCNSSTSFLVASDGETIGSVSYVGAGTFTSLSGNYTTTNIIESVSGTNIVVDAKFIADYMSGKTVSEATAALSPSAAKGSNGLNAFEAYALGLAPSDAQPVLGVTVSEEGKFVVTMKKADGSEITSAPNVQLVTNVKSGTAPGSIEASEGGDTIDPAQQNVPVKYYKAEVEILAK